MIEKSILAAARRWVLSCAFPVRMIVLAFCVGPGGLGG